MKVTTDKGDVEGTVKDRVVAFKGVPFAAPPVSERRWQRPQPATPWTGVRRCDRFGKSCIQPVFPSMDGTEPVGEQSEDCLYLNVWTTGGGTAARKPVMVWIHGGAFQIGNGIASAYDGTRLALKGAVVVTFNYRLGHLGFFAHPALEREERGGPVNFGLLDQIAALQWVQRNITEFGGDPGNVTIFGQSAGAMSVLALFASPLAANLFHKGVAQSAYAIPEHSRGKAIEQGAFLATQVFRAGDRPTAADLRRVTADKFALTHYTPVFGIQALQPVPSLAPVPVVGDEVLRVGIRDAFAAGSQLRLPLILGSTSNEQSILAAFGIDPVQILALIEQHAGPEAIENLKDLYRNDPELQIPDDLNDPARFGGLVLRDFLFTMQAHWIAEQHQARLDNARRYYFSYVPEAFRAESGWQHGVPHGGELVFPFDTGGTAYGTEGKFSEADRAMAGTVADYWFSFARTGTPAGPVPWPRHSGAFQDRILKLAPSIEAQHNFRLVRLQTYARMYDQLAPIIGG